ncbi:MAG: glycosyltransferase family 2 protein [Pseudomonadota bacterium]
MSLVLVGVTLLLWALTTLRAVRAVRRTPVLRPAQTRREPAHLAVFIPVRDEREDLPRLLASLHAQRDVRLDVVVFDDGSTDGTSAWLDEQARSDGALQVLHGEADPPAGWCGKTHALTRAVEAYGGDASLWLFVDADVELDPATLISLVTELEQQRVDLVSPLPTLTLETFWARVLGPNFAAVAFLDYPPPRVNDPADPTAFFNGQILLVRREVFVDSGGFAAVRDEVLEDVALARRIKARGGRLRVVNGQGLVRTRMYRTLREHVEGWSKNIFALLGSRRSRALFVALFVTLMSWLPLACLIAALIAWGAGEPARAALAGAGYLLPVTAQIALRGLGHAAPLYAPVAPLASLIVAGTLLRAAWSSSPRSWKGRHYPTKSPEHQA